MKIAVGSTNKTKVKAVEQAVDDARLHNWKLDSVMAGLEDVRVPERENMLAGEVIRVIPVSAASEVADQPFSDEETMQGAVNRARNALSSLKAEIGIGLEGGVVETRYGLFLCNWGALTDGSGDPVIAGGGRIRLPDEFLAPLKSGKELADVMDSYTKQHNIRSGPGAIGILTSGMVSRQEMFTHIVRMLLGQYVYRFGKNNGTGS